MGSLKQKYISHDISQRFRFLSRAILVFNMLVLPSAFITAFLGNYPLMFINLFVATVGVLSIRISRSISPQLSFYFFMVIFLIFSAANMVFWVGYIPWLTIERGLYVLTFLLFINMMLVYTTSYRSYQSWINLGLSLVAILFYGVFLMHTYDPLPELAYVLVFPIIFLVTINMIFSRIFLTRKKITEHYKTRYQEEKRHLMHVLSNTDKGYASFKLKYNGGKNPVNARVEHYNKLFSEMLHISQVSMDHIKLSDLNASGKQVFPDYQSLLSRFAKEKGFTTTLELSPDQRFHIQVFAIGSTHFGMMVRAIS